LKALSKIIISRKYLVRENQSGKSLIKFSEIFFFIFFIKFYKIVDFSELDKANELKLLGVKVWLIFCQKSPAKICCAEYSAVPDRENIENCLFGKHCISLFTKRIAHNFITIKDCNYIKV
jgi:hypothetical protein